MTEKPRPDEKIEQFHLWAQDERRAPEGAVVAYVLVFAAAVCAVVIAWQAALWL